MEVKIIELPRFMDLRGNLSFVENHTQIPFEMKRVYWIYDVPGGEVRGGHAFRTNQELIIALSGSFDVVLDDGRTKSTYHLNRSYHGLYVPSGIWRELTNFSTNAFALEVASSLYDPDDYVFDYNEFLQMKAHGEI